MTVVYGIPGIMGEVYPLCKEPDIMKVVEGRRARWLKHMSRSEDVNLCKETNLYIFRGSREDPKEDLQ
jgi:hypothetical protein